ncbi:hypothetical protein SPSIL_005790 [Sporomusa silvacetica DSM 10669]|uniref:NAD-dependent epimerase/dehydratase domain-containing protein n=1 Tax=Sporomusa silvacetica DSM 10669 TaxID=1123289 RepID=A0ABZ3IFM7_9FIRM|nr:NAD-dependent epimerase/dehydratase family protein [Sporomusa silvacetica]OZC17096.1 hypothetical protein SPSIL_34610 [Sporomusa silvacetica DSM 10669]
MKVIIFGATGMIGQGVLRECLLDEEVETVLAIGRSITGIQHEKLRELTHNDFQDLSAIESDLSGYDACLYCLGVSSAGMAEQDYHRVTYAITQAVAQTLVKLNVNMTFIYVSGAGTDSTEQGRTMWARIKGKTENMLLGLPFKSAYMFRPAFIQPKHGIVSKTKLYRVLYTMLGNFYPLLKVLFPKYATTTEIMGRAMIRAAKKGVAKRVLETEDINNIGL